MTDEKLQKLCAQGHTADKLADSGKTDEAVRLYARIIASHEPKKRDPYILAKATLGSLKALIKTGQYQAAFDIWNAEKKSDWALGINALENAQVSVNDLIIYDMLCAHMHSLQSYAKPRIASAVTQYMSRVCEHAEEVGDRKLMYQAINNWKHHLKQVFRSTIPFEWAKPIIAFEKRLGDQVKLRKMDFPALGPWEKPASLDETTTVQFRRPVPGAVQAKTKTGTR